MMSFITQIRLFWGTNPSVSVSACIASRSRCLSSFPIFDLCIDVMIISWILVNKATRFNILFSYLMGDITMTTFQGTSYRPHTPNTSDICCLKRFSGIRSRAGHLARQTRASSCVMMS